MKKTDNYICHVGVGWDDNPPGIGSGRYPHGSGKNPNQHDDSLKAQVEKLRKKGLSNTEIAKGFFGPYATAETLKSELTIERVRAREKEVARARELYEKTKGNASEVARIMYGDPSKESQVRNYIKDDISNRQARYKNTADYLKSIIDESKSGIVDVSTHSELYLGNEEDRNLPAGERMGVTKETKKVAIRMLEQEGYTYTTVKIPNGGHETTIRVLAKPGMSWKEIQQNKYNIDSVTGYSEDGGKTFKPVNPPVPIDLKRVYVRFGDQGGTEKDGTIELRRGVDDISLGGPLYAQVRIAVKGSKKGEEGYMKGMAFYSNDIPEGYDMIYNVNKKTGTKLFAENDKESSVFKTLKNDPDNPFGALIKPIAAGGQPTYIDSKGREKQGVINKTNDEGDWDKWSKKLASQFLSKQNIPMIEERLNVSILDKKAELEGIKNLTNPVIKQKLLDDYAEQTDTNASTLKAKGYRGTAFQVILPIPTLKDDEVYAPNYKNGEKVALIRYPHAGDFEIPICTVNNKNKLGNEIITKNGKDAIGINQHVADRLSGADFDGDTALVIPMTSNNIKVKSSDPLPGLQNWDHKTLYKLDDSQPTIKGSTKQKQMGIVTNLITDMTVGGAGRSEIERAVKHSMVVIDSEKHRLDVKKSENENDIAALVKKYQATDEKSGGASTILSRASAEAYVDKRKEITDVNKMTPEQQKAYKAGKKVYVPTGQTKMDGKKITDPSKMTPEELERYNAGKTVWRDTGKTKVVQEKLTQMAVTDDARDLVRDKSNKREMLYADYANELKALANEARKISRNMTFEKASPTAKETYKEEIESLERKLRIAESNQPKERKAQALGNAMANEAFKDTSVVWDYEHKQRERARRLEEARAAVGAKKEQIKITDKEWEAIQANAIAPTKLKRIIQNTDQEAFKKRATPKGDVKVSKAQKSLILSMANSNQYTNAEIADRLGLSPSTISKILNE